MYTVQYSLSLSRFQVKCLITVLISTYFNRKIVKHSADVSRAGGRFVPLVVSTTGVWHQSSLTELRKLVKYASTRRGESEPEAWKSVLARLGCSLAKGNEFVLKTTRLALQPDKFPEINPYSTVV